MYCEGFGVCVDTCSERMAFWVRCGLIGMISDFERVKIVLLRIQTPGDQLLW